MIKSILVTGGGSGIGAALAASLAEQGCQVIISGRRPDPLHKIATQSPKILALPSDVTDSIDQDRLVDALSKLPAPRAIFHGAGYFQIGRLDTLSHSDWQRSFDTNVTARWALSTKCAQHLQGGRVLFIGSDSGKNIRVGGAAYSVAQSASETLRRALQAEWVERDIAVSAFKPGLVDTEMVKDFLSKPESEFPAKQDFQKYIDCGEFIMPQTVAKFATWLLLQKDTESFKHSEWDIRDSGHHSAWLKGGLMGNA